ncbi:hypothetical protein [Rhodococcus chondri]|uniref:DUF8175 domain-containing protein n=1 Tax=Rhodococcus chondri TaxID=3065941 RepID=A0ABU7JXA5_9NOCA|nr:hypothetical protein [Rhodococcus sp. CC-R104]MEE2034648.1 hypothetical protein [Rhodococcus sp. CC-R104]
MTEQNTTGQTGDQTSAALDAENERSLSATKLTIGLAAVAVIVVVGIVLSIVMLFRGDDAEALVALDPATGGAATAQVEDGLFEPDPVFGKFDRVVYVPLDPTGVILSETVATSSRPVDQAPSGVMLQRIHGNMDLPFSTSDGPTEFTDNGVATGFSRTAQGAALAAAHYLAYLIGGDNRAEMVAEAGHSSDPAELLSGLKLPDYTAVTAMPMINVSFHPDLTLVKFGATVERSNGAAEVEVLKLPVVWREGTGWVVQLDSAALSGGFGRRDLRCRDRRHRRSGCGIRSGHRSVRGLVRRRHRQCRGRREPGIRLARDRSRGCGLRQPSCGCLQWGRQSNHRCRRSRLRGCSWQRRRCRYGRDQGRH